MSKMEIQLAGSGGQGVILASVILAEAAVQAGKYTAQTQSYGPEARGGTCKAEVLISDSPIGFTKVQHPDLLLALTRQALDRYGSGLQDDCIVMTDEELSLPAGISSSNIIRLPIFGTAKGQTGTLQTANIVAAGCINELLHIVESSYMETAVKMHVPGSTENINLKALKAGEELAGRALADQRG